MTVTIGPWTFDHALYDAEADVAYLSIGEPRPSIGEASAEGHILLYDEQTGEFCGLTLIGLRQIGAAGQRVVITPAPIQVESDDLSGLVHA